MVKDSLTLWGFSWDGWNSCLCGLYFQVSFPGIAHSWQKGSPNRKGQTSVLKHLSSSYLYHTCLWLHWPKTSYVAKAIFQGWGNRLYLSMKNNKITLQNGVYIGIKRILALILWITYLTHTLKVVLASNIQETLSVISLSVGQFCYPV